MKKDYMYALFLLLTYSAINAQGNWQWAREGIGNRELSATIVKVAPGGDVYAIGALTSGVFSFGEDTLRWDSAQNNMFLVKYDPLGNVKWLRGAWEPSTPLAANRQLLPEKLAVDEAGSVYVTGAFQDSIIAFGTDTLHGYADYNNNFLVKYDSSGNEIWARHAKVIGGGVPNTDVTIDAHGNIYAAGGYFGPIIIGSDTFDARSGIFITEYDPQGNLKWLDTVTSTNKLNYLTSDCRLASDNAGNTYLYGSFFKDTLYFGNIIVGSSSNDFTYYIVKYDSLHNVVWAKGFTGSEISSLMGLSISPGGDVYALGLYSNIMQAGTYILTGSSQDQSNFLLKLDGNGNVKWLQTTAQNVFLNNIAADPNGGVDFCGYYYDGNLIFGADTLPSAYINGYSIVGQIDSNGNPVWVLGATAITGNPSNYTENYSEAGSITVDAVGNIYTGGNFTYAYCIFGTDTLEQQPDDTFTMDYIGKIAQCYAPGSPFITSVPARVCYGDSATIVASGEGIGNLSWYSADTGGIFYSAGNSFTTPALTTSTNYYVQDSACGGIKRTAVTIPVNPNITTTIATSICEGSNYAGHTFSGIFADHYNSATGCDSMRTLILTVNVPTMSTTHDTTCDSALPYMWNGLTINTPGYDTVHLINAAGCDSAAVLSLAVYTATISTTNYSICTSSLPYSWNGLSIATAGNDTVHLSNSAGCDSMAVLSLTVNASINSTSNLFICPSDLPYMWNGLAFTEAGAQTKTGLITALGCDSSATLNLVVYPISSFSLNVSICAGAVYHFNSMDINITGSYNDTLQTVHGCDSIVTLHLTVNSALQTSLTDTACEGHTVIFNGQSLTQQGVYKDTLQSAVGCDSVVTLSLFINSSTVPTITRSNDTLQTQTYSSYQWLLNGLAAANGTSQDLVVTQNGNYSVAVINANGCTDTSAIIDITDVGIKDVVTGYTVQLYPNPNNGNFALQFSDNVARSVSITDVTGRIVIAAQQVSLHKEFDCSVLAGGLYLISVKDESGIKTMSVVVAK